MSSKRLKARAISKPALLRPIAEIEADYQKRLAEFVAWFETVPGAEWEIGSTDGDLIYCHWYAVAEKPEWGKVFCCHRIKESLEQFQQIVIRRDTPPPVSWKHWEYLGLEQAGAQRQAVVDRFHSLSEATVDAIEKRWIHCAYVRAISDIWYRDYGRR